MLLGRGVAFILELITFIKFIYHHSMCFLQGLDVDERPGVLAKLALQAF